MAHSYPTPRRARRIVFPTLVSCALVFAIAAGPLGLVSCSGEPEEPEEVAEKRPQKKKRRSSSASRKTSSSSKSRTSSRSSNSRDSDSSSARSSRPAAADSEVGYEAGKLLASLKSSDASSAFSSAYRSARRYYEQGKAAEADGEASKAERLFQKAKSGAEEVLAEYKEFKEETDGARKLIAEIEEAKKTAEAEGVAELAAIDFEDAVAELENAREALKDVDPDSVSRIVDSVQLAKGLLEDAVSAAERNRLIRERAVREKQSMLSYKEKAKAAGADSKALSNWIQAEQAERDADSRVKQGQFQDAVNTYQLAAQTYIRALETTVGAEQMKALIAKAEEERKEREAREMALRREEIASKERAAKAKAEALEKLRRDRQGGGTTYVPPGGAVPGGGTNGAAEARKAMAAARLGGLAADLNASLYRQELDAEDDEFLRENWPKLSSALSYDPDSGVALIDYSNSSVMRKDIEAIFPPSRSLRRKSYLSYINPMAGGAGGSEEAQSFLGNTKGQIFIPVPFKYRVRVTYDMSIQTMDANGSFNCYLMFDPRKKSSYLTEWIHWKYSSLGGRPKLVGLFPEKKFQGSANYWFDKTRDISMSMEFQMPAETPTAEEPTEEQLTDAALLTCLYDANGADEKRNEYLDRTPHTNGGWVGFRWSRAKFTVKKLQIAGILDKQLAVDQLRAKLKKPKKKSSTRSSEKETPDADDEGEGGDDEGEGGDDEGEGGDDEVKPPDRVTDPEDGFDF